MGAILLADDSALTRALLRAHLAPLNVPILEAADGQTALALARAEHPRVAVLDLDMPGLNGFEVCARLKADEATRDMQVFILTSHADAEVQGHAFGAGADGYFTKPSGTRALCERIAAVLGN